jgi:hypothetical protein
MLDGIELLGRDLAKSNQLQIQRLAIWRNGGEQPAKIFQVDPLSLGIQSELPLDVRPRKRVDLQLIKRLQRQPARETSGSMG